MQIIYKFLSKLLPPNTPTVRCPPGLLRNSKNDLPNLVVATFPRCGTHLLIDLILNNFSLYRQNPLYA